MERALKRVKAIKQGNPLDTSTMMGAQASSEQMEKILSYLDIGKQEGAEVLTGGKQARCRRRSEGRASILSRPSSRAITRCASSRKRSSGRWFR